jgi:oxygen-independent coproporphyrinogen-3 oxidase
MKDETLKIIGRHHTVADVVTSYRLAREAGFDNINMDLILGLPGETLDNVKRTLEQICALAPDNLTVHALALKRAARLNICQDEYRDYKMEITPEHNRLVETFAKEMHMEPYYLYRQKNMAGNFENVGYGHPGKEGIYNILIMEEKQTIVACGAGSVTKRVYGNGRIERCENVKDVTQYMERIDEMIERKRRLFA